MTTTPPTVPVCHWHPARETYLRCSRCDRPICPDCVHEAVVGQHCPECAGGARRGVRAPRTVFGGTLSGQYGHVTRTLIGINVAVAVLAVMIGGVRAIGGGELWLGLLSRPTSLHVWGGMIAGEPGVIGVADGEFYRLFTSMFLHLGLLHLLLNMWALWVVGRVLEPLLGRARFLALYLVSGLGGSVAVYLTSGLGVQVADRVLFGGVNELTVGASGAVFGLFGAFYVFLRRLRRDTSAITSLLVINLILTFVLPNISVAGHLGGLVTGAVVAAGLAYAPRQHRTLAQTVAVGAVVAILVLLTVLRTLLA